MGKHTDVEITLVSCIPGKDSVGWIKVDVADVYHSSAHPGGNWRGGEAMEVVEVVGEFWLKGEEGLTWQHDQTRH